MKNDLTRRWLGVCAVLYAGSWLVLRAWDWRWLSKIRASASNSLMGLGS